MLKRIYKIICENLTIIIFLIGLVCVAEIYLNISTIDLRSQKSHLTEQQKYQIAKNITDIDDALMSGNKKNIIDAFSIENSNTNNSAKVLPELNTYELLNLDNIRRNPITINNYENGSKSIVILYFFDVKSKDGKYIAKNNFLALNYVNNSNGTTMASAITSSYLFNVERTRN